MTSGNAEMPRALQRIITEIQSNWATSFKLPICQRCSKATTKVLNRFKNERVCDSCRTASARTARTCVTCRSKTRTARFGDNWAYCQVCWTELLPQAESILAHVLGHQNLTMSPVSLHRALNAATKRPADQLRLALDSQAHSDQWFSEPNQGSAAFLRFYGELRADFPQLRAPICAVCRQERPLPCALARRGSPRICRRCHAARFTEPCSRCAKDKTVTRRLPSGDGLCQSCDKASAERSGPCARCGELRVIAVRSNEGGVCARCRFREAIDTCRQCRRSVPCRFAGTPRAICDNCRKPRIPCSGCGKARIVNTRDANGAPLCHSCAGRQPEECVTCGESRRVVGRAEGAPLCEHCYPKHPVSFRDCTRCAQHRKIRRTGLCDRCTADDFIDSLFPAELLSTSQPARRLHKALKAGEEERTLLAFQRPQSVRLLGKVLRSTTPLSHALLDQLGNERTTRNIRSILIESGLLEQTDPHLSRFAEWIPQAADAIVNPMERAAFIQFATWVHLRDLRSRPAPISGSLASSRRVELRLVIDLLSWVGRRGRSLASMTQEDVDLWSLTQSQWHRVSKFLKWSRRNRLVSALSVRPPQAPELEIGGVSDEERAGLLQSILQEQPETLAGTKLAAALVLLYGIRPHQIVRIKLSEVTKDEGLWKIRVGTEDLYLPDQLGAVTQAVYEARDVRRMLHTASDHEWLLPGARAGYPIVSGSLRKRLRKLGIPIASARRGAIKSLAQEVDPSVLANLVGIHVRTAVKWRNAIAASRARYVGELLRLPD